MRYRKCILPALIILACLSMPALLLSPRARTVAQEQKNKSEKYPKLTLPRNTAGQVTSPTGVFNVKKAELTWIKQETHLGNARITVEFFAKPAANTIEFRYNHQMVLLKDEGTGVYAGVLMVETSSLTDIAEEDKKALGIKPPANRLHFDGRHVREEPKAALSKPVHWKVGDTLDLLGSPACQAHTDIARSLMITDPIVVDDPTRTYNPIKDSGNGKGAWSFGHIMTVLANTSESGITPEALTRRWLARWEHDQVVNDFTVEKRPNIKKLVIDPWPRIPGTDDLDLAKAPFRLIAIVNRVDLRDSFLFGVPPAALVASRDAALSGSKKSVEPQVLRDSPGGEARMIFGVVDRNQSPPANLPFTVIFEFGVYLDQCQEIKAWATQWYALKNAPINSATYRNKLTLITKQFIQPAQDPAKPKRSFALNQVRTNEIALVLPSGPGKTPGFWELREFRVPHEHSEKGHLRQVTVGQTPNNAALGSPEDLNNTAQVGNFINANVGPLLTNTHTVPIQFAAGKPFLGGRSLTLDPDFFWNAPGLTNNNARHHFSLNTCNGCHGGETKTPKFVMVSPTDTEPSGAAKLAPFLTGVTFPDPVDGQPRWFNDLARRQQDMDRLVCLPCFYQIFHRPVRMTH